MGAETARPNGATPPPGSQHRTRKCTVAKPPGPLSFGAYRSTGCSTDGLRKNSNIFVLMATARARPTVRRAAGVSYVRKAYCSVFQMRYYLGRLRPFPHPHFGPNALAIYKSWARVYTALTTRVTTAVKTPRNSHSATPRCAGLTETTTCNSQPPPTCAVILPLYQLPATLTCEHKSLLLK